LIAWRVKKIHSDRFACTIDILISFYLWGDIGCRCLVAEGHHDQMMMETIGLIFGLVVCICFLLL